MSRLHTPTISPRQFRYVAAATVGCYVLLVITGGAVRLTGSGLGCPDWPSCYSHQLTAALKFHPLIEFSNRLVTVAVTIISLAALVAALLQTARRRDLTQLAALVVAGLFAQVVLGGLVVLFKLNPYLVALHFALTLAVLGVAIVLAHRAGINDGTAVPLVGHDLIVLSRLVLGALGVLIAIGTTVSGAGPHAGAENTKRIAIAFRDIAELHSTAALFVIGLVLGTLFALHHAEAPPRVQRRAQLLLELLVLQGILGYTQYVLHDNAVVVEFHLAGATAVWSGAVRYYLALHEHPAVKAAGPIVAA
jgi:cytochrome c oxidase assembly protein subunit 15